ncbi:hypothetical protein C8F04DRAFT_943317 [Mycena alexandri]|uniref:Uncharacterized protein n=1 Tax=Mycena alexandri TaxID=1745969 RepID=A0AAD6TGN4_9AGAR|nr:hypothetical protein C8F04DRAFT_943317 [Mycena alexandri]
MPPFYTFSPKTTSISFHWPAELTGLERVALSAQGDLQRVLSAFFARPIVIALIYSHTFTKRSQTDNTLIPLPLPNPAAIASASPESPIVQNRQVHLQCGGKLVCTATSTVRLTSSDAAHLFLEEKYAIGQLFAKLGVTPSFELLDVGIGGQDDAMTVEKGFGSGPNLWRRYRLFVREVECEILEVFASRDMFVQGQAWLDEQSFTTISPYRKLSTNTLLWLAVLSLLIFELYTTVLRPARC